MYKSIKISGEAYKNAKALSKELEKSGELPGVDKVSLSVAVGYALDRTLENLKNKRKLLSSAGVWKDIDTEKMIKEIYDSRKISSRKKA
jgi:hypothetical protein